VSTATTEMAFPVLSTSL